MWKYTPQLLKLIGLIVALVGYYYIGETFGEAKYKPNTTTPSIMSIVLTVLGVILYIVGFVLDHRGVQVSLETPTPMPITTF